MSSKKVSKDIRNFANDLYNYIWTKHTFVSPILEKNFNDSLASTINKKKEKESNFKESIGEAVLSSQYLLRPFCSYCFTQIGKDFTHSSSLFNICVYNVIFNWIEHRSDIFCKVFDSAAIIAEAILFCDSATKYPLEIIEATEMFINFFETYLKEEFFPKGGWKQLFTRALECYSYLDEILEQFRNCSSYEKLEYNCELIMMLRDSPVMFPVECSVFCKKCKVLPSDKVIELYFDSSLLIKLKQVSLGDCISTSEVWQKLKTIEKSPQPKPKSVRTKKRKTVQLPFACMFLGGIETGGKHTKKLRKNRKRKNISKVKVDGVQETGEKIIDSLQSAMAKREQDSLHSVATIRETTTMGDLQNFFASKMNFLGSCDTKKTETLEECQQFKEYKVGDCMKSVESKRKETYEQCIGLETKSCPVSIDSVREGHCSQAAEFKIDGNCVQFSQSETMQNCAESTVAEEYHVPPAELNTTTDCVPSTESETN